MSGVSMYVCRVTPVALPVRLTSMSRKDGTITGVNSEKDLLLGFIHLVYTR